MADRLRSSLSPYLRQHADNPVDWWEWGPEAFAEARRRDVPVFLSIGYAACHWCHVMAHETFEDPAIGDLLAQRCVAIKVDREERPDVDAVYMDVTVALTGHGGWPMSVWLTPDGHAFHAGTYHPPTPRPGVPSFRQVLDAVDEAWRARRTQLLDGAAGITRTLAERAVPPPAGTLTASDVDRAVGLLAAQLDPVHGGFGGAPKFPPSTVLDGLLARAAQDDGEVADQAWAIVRATLEPMIRGGLHDQLDGGFARYCVDAAWVIPHFEKMLSDNALLLGVCARAAVEAERRGEPATLVGLLERTTASTADWLLRRMRTPQGALAASLDADADDGTGHAHEGASYVWTPAQLTDVLGEDGERVAALLGVTTDGTFEHGASVLQLRDDPADPRWFEGVRRRLLAARDARPQPARDDKVVAAWNGWAVASLVDAGTRLGRPDWVVAAGEIADAVLTAQTDDGGLRRVSLDGVPSTAPGAADDHASLSHGLLALAAATGDGDRLARGLALLERLHERFVADDGGLFDTADDAPALVRRPRDLGENATPSGASAALRADRLAHRLTGDDRWRERADALARTLAPLVARAPRAAGWALGDAAAELGARPPVEVAVVVTGDDDDGGSGGCGGALALARQAARDAAPGSVVAVGTGASSVPLLSGRPARDGTATVYVCRDHVCDLPVTTAADLHPLLDGTGR